MEQQARQSSDMDCEVTRADIPARSSSLPEKAATIDVLPTSSEVQSQEQAQIAAEDEVQVPDLQRDIQVMVKKVQGKVFDSWSETLKIEKMLHKSGGRLSRVNLMEETMQTKSEVWLQKQADDLQTLWECLSTMDRLLDIARQEVQSLRSAIP